MGYSMGQMMFTFRLAKETQIEALLQLTYNQKTTYLQPKLDLIQMTYEQFGHYFRDIGQVYTICENNRLLGYYWIEKRGAILHLHGLTVNELFRNRGIGTHILKMLESTYKYRMQAIELEVHRSNQRAKALYERCGYRVREDDRASGFFIMRKELGWSFEDAFLQWLLNSKSPSIRYLTLRQLVGLPETDTAVKAESQVMNHSGAVNAIISKQTPNGSWSNEKSYYTPKYTSTHWNLILLAELNIDPYHESMQRGVQFMLDTIHDKLQKVLDSGQYGFSCFWGNLLRYTLYARQQNHPETVAIARYLISQAHQAEWRCPRNHRLPCAWGAARGLWGLTALLAQGIESEVEAAICSGLRFLVHKFSLSEGAFPDTHHIHSFWGCLNFPLFYQADILFVLRILAELKRLDEPGVQPALTWLAERRQPNGTWLGSNPFCKRTWPQIGDTEEISRWVSLQAARILGVK